MKHFILIFSIVIFSTTSSAQVTFNGRSSETYSYLTGATELQPASIWALNIDIPLKLDYPIVIDSRSYDSVIVGAASLVFEKNGVIESIIWGTFLSVSDRKLYDTKFKSRILYQTTGSAPNRIQKFEFKAFGFNDEFEEDISFTDSGSIQIWVYEAGNKMEVKYGPTMTSKTFAFSANRNIVGFSFLKRTPNTFPFLTGAVTNPTLVNDTASTAELSAYPASGSVYTFTLVNNTNSTASNKKTGFVNCYPNPAKGLVNINNPTDRVVMVALCEPSGKQLKAFKLDPASTTQIDLEDFASGVYYFQSSGHCFPIILE